jgi:dynein intermediate chain
VSITCLDFPDSETATFWIGTEEGSVYQANRYNRASSKAGLSSAPDDIYRGHSGPITGIHFHPSSGSIDFSDLFLTSSVDWTVKLWRTKATSSTSAPTKSAPERSDKNAPGISPLTSFEEADDYVFDAKWHPNHPAMFGTVDGSGKFDLWNLNHDTEVSTGNRSSLGR